MAHRLVYGLIFLGFMALAPVGAGEEGSGAILEVRVESSDGTPLSGVLVRLFEEDEGADRSEKGFALTQEDGLARFQASAVQAGRYLLRADLEGFLAVEVPTFPVGEADEQHEAVQELRLVLNPVATRCVVSAG